MIGFGGPGAIGTTVLFGGGGGPDEIGVLPVVALVLPVVDPVVDFGDSESCTEVLPEVGVVAGVCATEFFLLAVFFIRLGPAVGGAFPLPRLRFLITSVFKLRGLTTPCSLRNSPQALQRG